MKPKVRFMASVPLLLVLLLQSCVPMEEQQASDPGGVAVPELTTCQPVVCWHGVTLASQHPESVQALARQTPGFENAQIARVWSKDDLDTLGWRDPEHHIFVTFQNSRGVALGQSASPTELGEIVARFGDPSHVFVWSNVSLGRLTASAVVVFASQGLVVYSGEDKLTSSGLALSPRLRLVGYNIASLPGLQAAVSALRLAGDSPPAVQESYVESYLAKAQSWHGFGDYTADQP